MLRRAENVKVVYLTSIFRQSGRIAIYVGKTVYNLPGRLTPDEWEAANLRQHQQPILAVRDGSKNLWHFRNRFYWDNDGLDASQVYALLVTREQREQQRIERAQAMVAMGTVPRQSPRGAIPDDLKQYVWQRDGGRCRQCGSGAELQFDHIIPIAMGGGTTAENLQVLCGPCNRRKGAGLTVR